MDEFKNLDKKFINNTNVKDLLKKTNKEEKKKNFDEEKNKDGDGNKTQIQTIDGIQFQWIKTGTYEGNGLARALTLYQFCKRRVDFLQ